ncbi:MAG: BCCT family transporter [Kordiimonas sp.]
MTEHNLGNIRLISFGIPVGVLLFTVLMSFWDFDGLLALTTAVNSWILFHFSSLFNWSTFAFVLTCVWAFLSPLGRVTIGGKSAEKILNPWQWFSITLCTTIAIGILFWATAEPIFHLNVPPEATGLKAGSDEAATFAVASLFMHWSFTPYAIYTVPALTFALAYYNMGKPFSLSGPLSFVLGKVVTGKVADYIDAVALFALIAGIAATLGAGMMSISGGIARVSGLETSPLLQAFVVIAIVGAFVISSVTGLHKGIRILSNINAKFFFLLCIFVFVAGPTSYTVSLLWDGMLEYVRTFVPRSLGIGSSYDEAWSQSWTVFYWANWLAWAPITALFLGRISRGYTVRQFIVVNFIAPSLFAIVWMSIFGGAAIHIDQARGVLRQSLETLGPESIAYEVLANYPLSSVLMVVFVFLSFVSYVTAADSNTDAMANVCLRDGDLSNSDSQEKQRGLIMWLKIMLAVLMGAAAWILTAYTGIDGVRMMSNLGGLPALFIVIALNVVLLLFGTRLLKRISDR